MQPVHLDEIAQRPVRYWNRDGLTELMLGLLMMVSGGVFLVAHALPKGSSFSQVWAFAAPVLWGGSALALKRGMFKLKEQLTFPRGGYVALPEPSTAYWVSALAAVVLVGGGYALIGRGELERWAWLAGPGIAMVFAVALLIGGLQYKLPHLLWLAAFSLLLGAWIWRLRAGFDGGLWVMVWLGGAFVLSGALHLRSFLNANPRARP